MVKLNPFPLHDADSVHEEVVRDEGAEEKSKWQKVWPVFACGAGLFSDGYLNAVIGQVGVMLSTIYPDEYTGSKAQSNVSSIAFAGTVVGQLAFGYVADHYTRKLAMTISAVILIVFAALCTGSYGAGGSVDGLFTMLVVCRFFLGIGIGGEYPAGSVAAAEATGEVKKGTRNRWFILFTNFSIDVGFVVAAFVPLVWLWILGTERHDLMINWRVSLGLGILPPFTLLFLRLRLQEPEQTKKNSMANTKTPYWLVIKYYWWRLTLVSLIWFIYDFAVYSAGIYSATIMAQVAGDGNMITAFGWNVVVNLFYIPGSFLGCFVSDWIGPRYCLILGLLQSITGFLLSGFYGTLATPQYIGAFVVVYGLFLSFGELGPGDNIGLLASKTSATAIRGQYYGIAAAVGKIGAFVGTYVFPIIIRNSGGSDTVRGNQAPFWVSSSLCVLSAGLAMLLPHVGQDTIQKEDRMFREYLERNGWDVSRLGLEKEEIVTVESGSGGSGSRHTPAEK
ncbi:major facilitator superfamily domain-containing protein [Tricharina praecox]|uniref:major facilitator superfamily domain-containing protein n=1 Tax=Tricharina praecox TaxID=43433 RepID=UPI00221E680D|nr:major facilitator superfamily domain-containing protein [Tricharina praecox]KAI5852141.1 major facilitator superfamily domain-containing protein [Tricharina praecox]